MANQTRIVQCGSCQTRLKVPVAAATVKCGGCQALLRLAAVKTAAAPMGDDRWKHDDPTNAQSTNTQSTNTGATNTGATNDLAAQTIECPKCSGLMELPARAAGKTVQCPQCAIAVKIPGGRDAIPLTPTTPLPSAAFPSAPLAPDPQPLAPSAATNPFTVSTPYPASAGYAATNFNASQYGNHQPMMSGWLICGLCFGVTFVVSLIPVVGPLFALLAYVTATIVSMVGFVLVLVKAFKEDVTQGLLSLFVPFYILFYMSEHWHRVRTPGLVHLGAMMVGLGAFLGGLLGLLSTSLLGAVME